LYKNDNFSIKKLGKNANFSIKLEPEGKKEKGKEEFLVRPASLHYNCKLFKGMQTWR